MAQWISPLAWCYQLRAWLVMELKNKKAFDLCPTNAIVLASSRRQNKQRCVCSLLGSGHWQPCPPHSEPPESWLASCCTHTSRMQGVWWVRVGTGVGVGSRRVGGGGWRVRWEDFSSVTTVNDIHQSHINIYFCFRALAKGPLMGL